MILDTTTRKLQVVLAEAKTTNDCPVVAAWFDSGMTSGVADNGGPSLSNTNGITAVDIVAAPAANTIRQVNELTIWNADTVSHGVTVRYNDNSTTYNIIKVTLLTGETLTYSKSLGWHTLDASGNMKSTFNGLSTSNLSDHLGLTSWTPADNSGAALALTINYAMYSIIDSECTIYFNITYPSTVNGSFQSIGGLPKTPAANITGALSTVGMASPAATSAFALTSGSIHLYNSTTQTQLTNAALSGATFSGHIQFPF